MKKIGIISDIHLEGSNIDTFKADWDYLIIAGDLTVDFNLLENFFSYKVPDIPIIYVLGNHEFEGKKFDLVPNQIKEFLKEYKNVKVLYNESVIIDDIKFIGTTLWSNFNNGDEEEMKWAKFNIIDFTYIFYPNKDGKYNSLTPENMLKENEKCLDFLNYELKVNEFNGTKIVISHFAPHKKSINEKYNKMNNSYWVNDCESLLGFSDYWIHGHTHNSFNYNVEGTNVICNARGHSKIFNLDANKNFDRNFTIEIEEKNLDLKSKRFKK